MKNQIIELIKGIDNPKILSLIYTYAKELKKKADAK